MSQTGKLIALVKKHPILYDLSHEGHKNTRLKDQVWQEIGDELNEKGEELKRKWKNLRDTFAKYLKVTKSKTGGPHRRKMAKKWQWAALMEDFTPHLSFAKKLTTNIVEAEIPDDDIKMEYFENVEMNSTDFEFREKNTPDLPDLPDIPDLPGTTYTIATVPSLPPPKRKRRNECVQTSSVDNCWVNYLKNKKNLEMDETDLLFAAHAQCIKKFSLKRQAITKMKIAQVVAEQELLNLEETLASEIVEQSLKTSRSSRSIERSENNSPYHSFTEPPKTNICDDGDDDNEDDDYRKATEFLTVFVPEAKEEEMLES